MRIETKGSNCTCCLFNRNRKVREMRIEARDTYEKLYAILTRESSDRWDFRTLNQSSPVNSTLGKVMGDLLVRLGYLDCVEDRFKYYVPTRWELYDDFIQRSEV